MTSIVWDNGCFAGSTDCETYQAGLEEESNNYVLMAECPATQSEACDPKIYVSFVGSDADENYMESAGKRISRFRQYSVSDMYLSAKNAFSKYSSEV